MINWSKTRRRGENPPIFVNMTDKGTFLDDIAQRLQTHRGFSVATLNLDHVVKLRQMPKFSTAYASHTHITADGNPIVWLSRLAGRRIHLLPGSELIEPIAEHAAAAGSPIALFGSAQSSLDAAASALKRRFPGLEIVACISPPMGFEPDTAQADAYIDQLIASRCRLCYLALGAPKQEIFAAYAQKRMPQTGFISIGAGLDFISGTQTRAPAWVRKLAIEWLWRLMGNPRRLTARYASCIALLPSLMVQALHTRRTGA